MRRMYRLLLPTVAAIVLATGAGAQLPLREALARADRGAFANRAADARAHAQRAQSLAPLRGVFPTVRMEAGFVRTTDPIATFGATLRQRAVTQAAFDPHRLNYPAPVGNYQAGLVLEQPLFNLDAWTGRRSASRAADATALAHDWTVYATRVDVIRAYYGAILAAERVSTLDAASRAAHAHLAQAEAMVRNGMATKSDALLAAVRAGDIDAQLAEARGAAITAEHQFRVVLGDDGRVPVDLPPTLPAGDRIREVVVADTADARPVGRADVGAADAALAAARGDVDRARAAYLPRLNSFARYDWNSAGRLYGGDRSWTVGVMASWSPFAGASELSDLQASSARASVARAEADAAAAQARLDVEQTATALRVALAKLEIAERAVDQSAEAHRIVARKYEGGLATVVELLDAQASETQSRLAASLARFTTITADAERRRALGADPDTLAVLDDASLALAPASSPN
jgi:outer membrane protein TolC